MGHDHFLELPRINVVTAAKDHVLFAIDDRKITFFVNHADITRMKPASAKCFGGSFRTLVIALHDIRPSDNHFTTLAGSNFAVVIVKTFHFHAEDRLSDSSRLRRPFEMVKGRERRRFGKTVAFHHTDSEFRFERLHHLNRHGSTARGTDLHRLSYSAYIVAGL